MKHGVVFQGKPKFSSVEWMRYRHPTDSENLTNSVVSDNLEAVWDRMHLTKYIKN